MLKTDKCYRCNLTMNKMEKELKFNKNLDTEH